MFRVACNEFPSESERDIVYTKPIYETREAAELVANRLNDQLEMEGGADFFFYYVVEQRA